MMQKSDILNKWFANENNEHVSCPMLKYFDASAENQVVVEYSNGEKQLVHIWSYMNSWESCNNEIVRYMVLGE